MKIYLAAEVISSFNSALNKLTGYNRRAYAAELCEKFFYVTIQVNQGIFFAFPYLIYDNQNLHICHVVDGFGIVPDLTGIRGWCLIED